MTILEVKEMPTLFKSNGACCHESVLKSYQILLRVKDMLKRKDSNQTIIEEIEAMEMSPAKEIIYEGKSIHEK